VGKPHWLKATLVESHIGWKPHRWESRIGWKPRNNSHVQARKPTHKDTHQTSDYYLACTYLHPRLPIHLFAAPPPISFIEAVRTHILLAHAYTKIWKQNRFISPAPPRPTPCCCSSSQTFRRACPPSPSIHTHTHAHTHTQVKPLSYTRASQATSLLLLLPDVSLRLSALALMLPSLVNSASLLDLVVCLDAPALLPPMPPPPTPPPKSPKSSKAKVRQTCPPKMQMLCVLRGAQTRRRVACVVVARQACSAWSDDLIAVSTDAMNGRLLLLKFPCRVSSVIWTSL